jgi:thiol-disulfide isomerase/thioredoxin
MGMTRSFLNDVQDISEPVRDLILFGSAENIQPLHLADLSGHAILLFVLGIDCGSCKQLARILTGLRYEYAPEIEFIGVCIQNGCDEKLPEFASVTLASFPLTHSTNRDLCGSLGIPRSTWLYFPTIIAIDSRQRLRGVFAGKHEFFNNSTENLRVVLDELSSEVRLALERAEATQ